MRECICVCVCVYESSVCISTSADSTCAGTHPPSHTLLQQTATDCNRLQQPAPSHTHSRNHVYQPHATPCNTPQHIATYCITLHHCNGAYIQTHSVAIAREACSLGTRTTHCNTLQHTATYCNTYIQKLIPWPLCGKRAVLGTLTTRCNTLQHTASHCNTLQQIYTETDPVAIAREACSPWYPTPLGLAVSFPISLPVLPLLYVYMCIYIYICMYIYMYVCIHTRLCIYTYTYNRVHKYIYIDMHPSSTRGEFPSFVPSPAPKYI